MRAKVSRRLRKAARLFPNHHGEKDWTPAYKALKKLWVAGKIKK